MVFFGSSRSRLPESRKFALAVLIFHLFRLLPLSSLNSVTVNSGTILEIGSIPGN